MGAKSACAHEPFARQIWKAWHESLGERGEYLRDMLKAYVKLKPTFLLDVGAGRGYNALAFREEDCEIVAVDLRFAKNNILKQTKRAHLVIADGQFLPLKKDLFDFVLMFSVIEYITDKELALKEALSVLKSLGILAIQTPNRYFPIDFHSGLPLLMSIPVNVRNPILKGIGYERLTKIDVPSLAKIKKTVLRLKPESRITVIAVTYPPEFVPPLIRPIYQLLRRTGVLNLIPLGYLVLVKDKLETLHGRN